MTKKIKLYQQTAKSGVVKILTTIPLIRDTMRQPIIKPWKRTRTLEPEKNDKKIQKKHEKVANIFKNC